MHAFNVKLQLRKRMQCQIGRSFWYRRLPVASYLGQGHETFYIFWNIFFQVLNLGTSLNCTAQYCNFLQSPPKCIACVDHYLLFLLICNYINLNYWFIILYVPQFHKCNCNSIRLFFSCSLKSDSIRKVAREKQQQDRLKKVWCIL